MFFFCFRKNWTSRFISFSPTEWYKSLRFHPSAMGFHHGKCPKLTLPQWSVCEDKCQGPSYILSFTLVKECTQGVHELEEYLWNDDNVWIHEWMDEWMTFFRRWLRSKYLFYCLLPCHLAFLSSSLAPGLIKGVVDGPTSYIRVSYSGSAMTSYGFLTSLNIFYSLQ